MRIDQRLGTVDQVDADYARQCWDIWRVQHGYQPGRPLLSQPGENMKLAKGDLVSYGLSLAQARVSGINVCPWSTPVCRACCVAENGNGRYDSVTAARIMKTQFLLANPAAFCSLLAAEIDAAHAKHGKALRVRLNTFSDIAWETVAPWLFSGARRNVRFYDYTKGWHRVERVPRNYRLTLSASENTTEEQIRAAVSAGHNVAVVIPQSRSAAVPAHWRGLQALDGDSSDERSDDPRRVVVALRAKGRMRRQGGTMVKSA